MAKANELPNLSVSNLNLRTFQAFPLPQETHQQELMEEEAEGNAAIIAVFLVVIVGILVLGAVFKFSIHKKLFRARYETVAG